jgi:hypothetical protein
MSYLLVIKPEKLLRVELTDGTQLVVTEVRYSVAVDAGGSRRVAIELQWDPHEQAPRAEYTCPVSRLEQKLTPPALVKRVHPYLP